MSRDIALRHYVISQQQMHEGITIATITNDLRRIKKYKNKSYNTIYKAVQRQFERKTVEDKKRKRTKRIRTKTNISHIRKMLHRNKECSIRDIKSKLNRKHVQMSFGSIQSALKDDLTKKKNQRGRLKS